MNSNCCDAPIIKNTDLCSNCKEHCVDSFTEAMNTTGKKVVFNFKVIIKECKKCLHFKSRDKFAKDKNRKDGLFCYCKKCSLVLAKSYSRTKDGVVTIIYASQKNSSKKRIHERPSYTKQELKNWLYSKELFHKLFNDWEDSDFKKNLKPSVDRIDDDIGYTMENIQLTTWEENNTKGTISSYKRVHQFDLEGNFITSYRSMTTASIATNTEISKISLCCNGYRKKTNGFRWKLVKEKR